MLIKTIHLKFRLMNSAVWFKPRKRLRLSIPSKKIIDRLGLDNATENWHSLASENNSPEMLWMLSLHSAALNLQNISRTEIKIFTDSSNMQEYFRQIYIYTRDLWYKEYPINILFTGSDVIFKNEVSFSGTSGFQMFNYANLNKEHISRVGSRNNILGGSSIFSQYLNCDIRFFSYDMDKSLWEIGNSWADNWTSDIWEYEQDLYNAMLRGQKKSIIQIRPDMAYQAPADQYADKNFLLNWNQIKIENSKIVHLHSTRSPDKALKIARKLLFG